MHAHNFVKANKELLQLLDYDTKFYINRRIAINFPEKFDIIKKKNTQISNLT